MMVLWPKKMIAKIKVTFKIWSHILTRGARCGFGARQIFQPHSFFCYPLKYISKTSKSQTQAILEKKLETTFLRGLKNIKYGLPSFRFIFLNLFSKVLVGVRPRATTIKYNGMLWQVYWQYLNIFFYQVRIRKFNVTSTGTFSKLTWNWFLIWSFKPI